MTVQKHAKTQAQSVSKTDTQCIFNHSQHTSSPPWLPPPTTTLHANTRPVLKRAWVESKL